MSGESPPPRFQSAMFLLYPHRDNRGGVVVSLLSFSSYEATNLIHPYDLTGT